MRYMLRYLLTMPTYACSAFERREYSSEDRVGLSLAEFEPLLRKHESSGPIVVQFIQPRVVLRHLRPGITVAKIAVLYQLI